MANSAGDEWLISGIHSYGILCSSEPSKPSREKSAGHNAAKFEVADLLESNPLVCCGCEVVFENLDSPAHQKATVANKTSNYLQRKPMDIIHELVNVAKDTVNVAKEVNQQKKSWTNWQQVWCEFDSIWW